MNRRFMLGGLLLALACQGDLKTDPTQAPAAMALFQGSHQVAEVGTAVPLPPAVLVTTETGDPAEGAVVVFAVTAGGGSITGPSATTGPDGIATVGSWTLGTVSGSHQLTATSAGLTGSPITFSATARPGAPAKAELVTPPPPSGVSGVPLSPQPSIQLQDIFGNPDEVAGTSVTAAVQGAGASLGGTTTVLTDASGTAHFTDLRVNGAPGDYSLSFSSPPIPPVSASLHLAAGSAVVLSKHAGDNQVAVAGTAVSINPAVIVRDASANPLAGVEVTFAIGLGGGSIAGAVATTNAQGIASSGSWTVGAIAGLNTLTATIAGLPPVTFDATGIAGAAATLIRNSGDNQIAPAGSPVPINPTVLVQDDNGNAVAGFNVSFSVTAGGGTIQTSSSPTNAQGLASGGTWTLGATAGSNSLTASAPGLVGSPAVFMATGAPITGPIASLVKTAGDNQTAVVGTTLPESLVVRVADVGGTGIPGMNVGWTVTSGGGSLSSASTTTDLNGLTAVRWTLGPLAQGNSVTASAGGFTQIFTATSVAGAPSALLITTQPGGGPSGVVFAQQPLIQLLDANGNAVSQAGVAISAAIVAGGGVLGGTTTVPTNGAGQAQFTDLAILGLVGSRSLEFTAPGLSSALSDLLTISAGPATTLIKLAGDNQNAPVGLPVAIPPRVGVVDASGNPVPGVTVDFTVTGGGGTIGNASTVTNDVGRAFGGTWTLGPGAGTNTVSASSTGLAGSPVVFHATGTGLPPGPVAAILKVDGDGQTAIAGSVAAESLVVQVVDANNTGVPGIAVTWTILSGGGTVATSSATTNASGLVAAAWTLGVVAAPNTVRAAAGGFNTTFAATGVAGPPVSLSKQAGDNQVAPTATAVPINPAVRAADANGNPVSGVMVGFTVTGGNGSIAQANAFTNTQGVATGGAWTLGPIAGPNTLRATATGLAGSPLTFNATATPTSNAAIPIIDMGGGTYFGHAGRLYPNGNTLPAAHAGAGAAKARNIQPRGFNGNPNPAGRFVFLSIGMSNTAMEWCIILFNTSCNSWSLSGRATTDPAVNNAEMIFANGARAGQDAATWDSPADLNYDIVRDSLLTPQGLSERQVEVIWLKVVNKDPVNSLPSPQADAIRMVSQYGDILRALKVRYPNLEMVFLSSRIYAGYSSLILNPEPYAYESGFAVKWVIEAQISQMANGGVVVDPRAGNLNLNTVAPWIGWGPYLWADGLSPRSDGLTWAVSDYETDLTHPNVAGQTKVAGMLLNFFKTDARAACWFLAGRTCP